MYTRSMSLMFLFLAIAVCPVMGETVTATFSVDADGWSGSSSGTWQDSDGEDGTTGWLQIDRTDGKTGYAIATSTSSGGAFVGDLRDKYGELIGVEFYLKDIDGGGSNNPTLSFESPKIGGVYCYWKYVFDTALTTEWTKFSVPTFDPTWTDAEATTAGWTAAGGTATFATVTQDVGRMYLYDNGPNGGTNQFGVDTVSITAVPEPSTICLVLWGVGLLALAAVRRRRRTQ